jgi:membrane-associated protein
MGINPEHILQSGGVLLVAAIVFAESGLLIGFFLPGDTLLFTAGFFASQDKLPIAWLLIAVVAAAIIGDNVGYTVGRRMGHRIFKKKDGILFRAEYINQAEKFYERHGGKTITIARFVPVVRTFAPIVAGVGKMDRRKFMLFNVVGATVWGAGVTLLGYAFGSRIPNIDKYLLPVVGAAMLLTFCPPLVHILKDAETRSKLFAAILSKLRFLKLK